MSQLVFTPPGRDTPGYLRRAREALSFQESMQDKPTVQALDNMIAFLLNYITEPKDRDEAREILIDASEEQFMEMLKAVTGDNTENPT